MAIYVYRCPECNAEFDVEGRMIEEQPVFCPECGAQMSRRPQKLAVNWGGLKPSQGFVHPAIKRFIDDAPRRREEEAIRR